MLKKSGSYLTRREALCMPLAVTVLSASPQRWRSEEVRRISAPEANQAVAADENHLYTIGNYVIGKYEKETESASRSGRVKMASR